MKFRGVHRGNMPCAPTGYWEPHSRTGQIPATEQQKKDRIFEKKGLTSGIHIEVFAKFCRPQDMGFLENPSPPSEKESPANSSLTTSILSCILK